MKKNKLKELLAKQEVVVGCWVEIDSIVSSRILSRIGFDFLIIDCEHAKIGLDMLASHIQTLEATETIPIVRVLDNSPALINQALDLGSLGIISPLIETKESALQLVKASKYPLSGVRGVGAVHACNYGIDLAAYVSAANDEIMVIAQIETVKATEHLTEILSVEGIDVFFIGPFDLATSMGYMGNPKEGEVLEKIKWILTEIKNHGRISGIYAPDIATARSWVSQGVQLLTIGPDLKYLTSAAREELDEARKILK